MRLDQRARNARLRLERIEPLFVPRAAVTDSWLRRALYLVKTIWASAGSIDNASKERVRVAIERIRHGNQHLVGRRSTAPAANVHAKYKCQYFPQFKNVSALGSGGGRARSPRRSTAPDRRPQRERAQPLPVF